MNVNGEVEECTVVPIFGDGAFSRTFSRVKLTYNEKYTTVVTFNRAIEKKIDLFRELGVKSYLKIYVLAIKPKYRHRGIGKEMIKSAEGLCASASIPAIAGIFSTAREQQIAAELGYTKYNEIYYIRYLIDEKIVFWDTGLGNYGAALMGYRIPHIQEIPEVESLTPARFSIDSEFDDEESGD